MEARLLPIANCYGCHKMLQYGNGNIKYYCATASRDLRRPDEGIPDWCPLIKLDKIQFLQDNLDLIKECMEIVSDIGKAMTELHTEALIGSRHEKLY